MVQEFRHAWEGYRTYAWGHDALRPLSRSAHDGYGVSLCMTPLDAFLPTVRRRLESHLDAR